MNNIKRYKNRTEPDLGFGVDSCCWEGSDLDHPFNLTRSGTMLIVDCVKVLTDTGGEDERDEGRKGKLNKKKRRRRKELRHSRNIDFKSIVFFL